MLTTMREYFRNIYLAVKTIMIGMRITLKYCFARTVTVQYPDVAPVVQPRFRGFHHYEIEKCIACEQCVRVCPVDCIHIEKTGPRKIDKETGVATGGEILRYAIDYSRCMFCALCTEPCPTNCIRMGSIHDLSGYDRQSMVVEFAELARQGLRTPMPIWMRKQRLPEWARMSKQTLLNQAQQAGKGGNVRTRESDRMANGANLTDLAERAAGFSLRGLANTQADANTNGTPRAG